MKRLTLSVLICAAGLNSGCLPSDAQHTVQPSDQVTKSIPTNLVQLAERCVQTNELTSSMIRKPVGNARDAKLFAHTNGHVIVHLSYDGIGIGDRASVWIEFDPKEKIVGVKTGYVGDK